MKKAKMMTWVVSLLAAGLISSGANARDYRLGLLTPANHVWSQAAEGFARDFSEKSGGKDKVAVFPAAQLGNEAQMLKQLQTGALDMAFLTAAELSNRAPEMSALFAPYLVKNVAQAGKLLGSPEAAKLLQRLPARAGVVGIGFGTGGLRQILSRHPLDEASQLKGKKFRVTPTEPLRNFYSTIGAVPTPIPFSGVFDALANAQVDAIDMDLEGIMTLKFHTQADTIVLSNHMMWPVVGVVSARVWKAMPPADREQVQALMNEHLKQTFSAYVEKEAEWAKAVRETGKTVKEVGPPFFGDAIATWEKHWVSKAPDLPALREAARNLP